ncbi:probable inactive purple acid phosphatase 28 isoform X9 [Amborella trichopoda]|uniref:probable inactive purple acid phosphatase 28 isoform X9 n=1 Tax=Amborella trichopoda TaxID=13333 RepID=UPI0005D3592F|nr:probable inactive purple acid phosphatase 28 isoform X9 [Amborella trichopoda]|eukprot:XP_011623892.1 probable inactive purple acid phosphatase 28 isoform X9 [Amborella trichopoda]
MCRNKLRKCDPRPILHLLIYLLFIYATLLVIHTIFGRLFIGNHAVKIKRSATLPLRFNSQGTFKILQVADMHFANGVMSRCRDVLPFEFHYCTDLNTSDFFRRIVREERPDFIAFTGDNIFGPSTSDAAESLIKAFHPAIESKIPWAAILGNHDQESTMTREELMTYLSAMDYSVSQVNPVTYGYSDGEKKVREIDGFGNYNIEVSGAIGSELANMSILNLYFLDSGDRSTVPGIRGYGWIRETQQIWLRQISEMIKVYIVRELRAPWDFGTDRTSKGQVQHLILTDRLLSLSFTFQFPKFDNYGSPNLLVSFKRELHVLPITQVF